MPIPDYQALMMPVLRVAEDRKEHLLSDFRVQVANQLNLSDEDVAQRLPSGSEGIFANQNKLIVKEKSLKVQLVSGNQKGAGSPEVRPAQAGEWDLFEETTLEGSITGTVQAGRIFKTTSGNVYEVTGLTLQLVLELQPGVTVLKNGEVYKLVVKGFAEPLICKLLSVATSTSTPPNGASTPSVIETQINDTFEGWDGETIFKLSNGQIWQQAAYAYTYRYAYRPKVLIYLSGAAYRMKVEGVDSTILVKRLR